MYLDDHFSGNFLSTIAIIIFKIYISHVNSLNCVCSNNSTHLVEKTNFPFFCQLLTK